MNTTIRLGTTESTSRAVTLVKTIGRSDYERYAQVIKAFAQNFNHEWLFEILREDDSPIANALKAWGAVGAKKDWKPLSNEAVKQGHIGSILSGLRLVVKRWYTFEVELQMLVDLSLGLAKERNEIFANTRKHILEGMKDQRIQLSSEDQGPLLLDLPLKEQRDCSFYFGTAEFDPLLMGKQAFQRYFEVGAAAVEMIASATLESRLVNNVVIDFNGENVLAILDRETGISITCKASIMRRHFERMRSVEEYLMEYVFYGISVVD